jgi:hypothetical protein
LIAESVKDGFSVVEREIDLQTMISVSDAVRFLFFVKITSLFATCGWSLGSVESIKKRKDAWSFYSIRGLNPDVSLVTMQVFAHLEKFI